MAIGFTRSNGSGASYIRAFLGFIPACTASNLTDGLLPWQIAAILVIRRVPQRNALVVLGDCNCPLRKGANAGHKVEIGTGASPPDQTRLQGLLEGHSLVQLNSWSRAAGATYIHSKGSSRVLSTIILRSQQSDARAFGTAQPAQLAQYIGLRWSLPNFLSGLAYFKGQSIYYLGTWTLRVIMQGLYHQQYPDSLASGPCRVGLSTWFLGWDPKP